MIELLKAPHGYQKGTRHIKRKRGKCAGQVMREGLCSRSKEEQEM